MSEATSAFGNGAVFLERFVTEPRHIEIRSCATAMDRASTSSNASAAYSGGTRRWSGSPFRLAR